MFVCFFFCLLAEWLEKLRVDFLEIMEQVDYTPENSLLNFGSLRPLSDMQQSWTTFSLSVVVQEINEE